MYRIRRLICMLGGFALSMLALGVPAFAMRVPPPGQGDPSTVPPQVVKTHLVMLGGMPGWQITLIAVGAALLGAAAALLLEWARSAHRRAGAGTA
jgi:hypothetical protein